MSKRFRLSKSIDSTFSSRITTSCSGGTRAETETSAPFAIEYFSFRPRPKKGIAKSPVQYDGRLCGLMRQIDSLRDITVRLRHLRIKLYELTNDNGSCCARSTQQHQSLRQTQAGAVACC